MPDRSEFILHPFSYRYKFNEEHPFNPKRLELTVDLLARMGAIRPEDVVVPPIADEAALHRVHIPAFVSAVRTLSSASEGAASREETAEAFGLHTSDTPLFPNMHEVTSAVVGGSVHAAEKIMSGQIDHALHLAGGLHHAMRDKASGFCVYNDASAAIASIREKYQARVLYIDTDVHHGDGVQWSFYTDPHVCTLSIHETGKFLFPGTGYAHERGEAEGFGACVNVPVEPYTEDESWMYCFREALERVTARFKPDVIVSQHGCDAHAFDPLAHVQCSMDIYLEMPSLIHEAAHRYCDGRWLALGGGGYDLWRVVPRAWSMLWLEMIGHPAISAIRAGGDYPLPQEWLQAWQPHSPVELPLSWLDNKDAWATMPRRQEIATKNMETLKLSLLYHL